MRTVKKLAITTFQNTTLIFTEDEIDIDATVKLLVTFSRVAVTPYPAYKMRAALAAARFTPSCARPVTLLHGQIPAGSPRAP